VIEGRLIERFLYATFPPDRGAAVFPLVLGLLESLNFSFDYLRGGAQETGDKVLCGELLNGRRNGGCSPPHFVPSLSANNTVFFSCSPLSLQERRNPLSYREVQNVLRFLLFHLLARRRIFWRGGFKPTTIKNRLILLLWNGPGLAFWMGNAGRKASQLTSYRRIHRPPKPLNLTEVTFFFLF